MKTILSRQIKICKIVRRVAEQVERAYKDDFCIGGLCGLCALASYGIYLGFKREYIPVKYIYGKWAEHKDTKYAHCWVQSRGLNFDVTATQFGVKEKIYITDVGSDKYIPKLMGEFEEFDWTSWTDLQCPRDNKLIVPFTKALIKEL